MSTRFKKLYPKIIGIILAVCIAVPGSLAFLPPKQAQADTASCFAAYVSAFFTTAGQQIAALFTSVPANDSGNKTGSAENAGNARAQTFKDCIFHALALAIAKTLLTQLTNSIVSWINSGFDGSPSFVTNPTKFLLNVGDQVLGETILGSNLAFLCSPFQLQVKLAIVLNTYSSTVQQKTTCTLSQVVKNVNNAFNDFGEGGWSGWVSITQGTANNPWGAYLEASAHVENTTASRQNIELFKLNWGSGFLSYEVCTRSDGSTYTQHGGGSVTVLGNTTSTGGPESSTDKCTVQTPGHVIGEQLNKSLGITNDQLGLADDFDKIFNALQNQFLSHVLGPEGLLGLGKTGGDSSGPSILDQLLGQAQANESTKTAEAGTKVGQAGSLSGTGGSTQTTKSPPQDIALGKPVNISGAPVFNHPSSALVDGDRVNVSTNGSNNVYRGVLTERIDDPWLEVDLQSPTPLDKITIFQNLKPGDTTGPTPFHVEIWDDAHTSIIWQTSVWGTSSLPLIQDFQRDHYRMDIDVPAGITGRYVRLQADTPSTNTVRLGMAELEVYPNTAPKITLNGQTVIVVNVNSSFTDPGYTAFDNEDGDITSKVVVTGLTSINPSVAGNYTITYSVTDSKGLSTVTTRTVMVQNLTPTTGP